MVDKSLYSHGTTGCYHLESFGGGDISDLYFTVFSCDPDDSADSTPAALATDVSMERSSQERILCIILVKGDGEQ